MKTVKLRVPTRVHTRKLDRSVARARMEHDGIKQINKHKDDFGHVYSSYFAENWRDYAEMRVAER